MRALKCVLSLVVSLSLCGVASGAQFAEPAEGWWAKVRKGNHIEVHMTVPGQPLVVMTSKVTGTSKTGLTIQSKASIQGKPPHTEDHEVDFGDPATWRPPQTGAQAMTYVKRETIAAAGGKYVCDRYRIQDAQGTYEMWVSPEIPPPLFNGVVKMTVTPTGGETSTMMALQKYVGPRLKVPPPPAKGASTESVMRKQGKAITVPKHPIAWTTTLNVATKATYRLGPKDSRVTQTVSVDKWRGSKGKLKAVTKRGDKVVDERDIDVDALMKEFTDAATISAAFAGMQELPEETLTLGGQSWRCQVYEGPQTIAGKVRIKTWRTLEIPPVFNNGIIKSTMKAEGEDKTVLELTSYQGGKVPLEKK